MTFACSSLTEFSVLIRAQTIMPLLRRSDLLLSAFTLSQSWWARRTSVGPDYFTCRDGSNVFQRLVPRLSDVGCELQLVPQAT